MLYAAFGDGGPQRDPPGFSQNARELLGSGSILGFKVIPEALYDVGYVNNGLMVLAPGAFLLLGVLVWVQRAISGYIEK